MTSVEARLQRLEDQLAIYQLVCGYGYAVDGCNVDALGRIYLIGRDDAGIVIDAYLVSPSTSPSDGLHAVTPERFVDELIVPLLD